MNPHSPDPPEGRRSSGRAPRQRSPDPNAVPNLNAILSIPVTVQVVLGSTSLPVASLMKLARGAVDLARSARRRSRRHRRQRHGSWRAARSSSWTKPASASAFRCSRSLPAAASTGRPERDGSRSWPQSGLSNRGAVLTGPERAAALLLMLGAPAAARLLKHLRPARPANRRAGGGRARRRLAVDARAPCRGVRG